MINVTSMPVGIDNYQQQKNKNRQQNLKGLKQHNETEKTEINNNVSNSETYGVPSFIQIGNELIKSMSSTEQIECMLNKNDIFG